MNIFRYTDYKEATLELLKLRPNNGRGELSRLAKWLGVNATLVSQVLRGPKDFTPEQAYATAQYLGLSPAEADYFLLLAQSSRAGSRALRQHYKQKIDSYRAGAPQLASRLNVDRTLSDEERARFYSSWLYAAVRLFTSVGKGQTARTVAERFRIPPSRAQGILRFLADCGLCVEDGGTFRMGPLQTHIEFGSPFLVQHLNNWRMKASQNIERTSDEELQFSACVSLSKKDFERIREQLTETIRKAAAVIKDSPAEDIACFNIDWIRVHE